MSEQMKQIAELLNAKDAHQSWVFCVNVRRYFGNHNQPSEIEIVEGIRKIKGPIKTPYLAAQRIRESRAYNSVDVTNGPPRSGNFHRKKKGSRSPSGPKEYWPINGDSTSTHPIGSGLENLNSTSPVTRHDPRKFRKGFRKCKHGVAITEVCHLCKGGRIDY